MHPPKVTSGATSGGPRLDSYGGASVSAYSHQNDVHNTRWQLRLMSVPPESGGTCPRFTIDVDLVERDSCGVTRLHLPTA